MNLNGAHRGLSPRSRRKRVGRGPGSGHGKTACRGISGARSRSGNARKRAYEGGQMPLFRRLPKRGFSNARHQLDGAVVNLSDLKAFAAGSTVSPAELFAKNLVPSLVCTVKVLGAGDLDRALTVRAHGFSRSAMDKITKAGGKAEVI
jgi:large subunit ribosomal protein L15